MRRTPRAVLTTVVSTVVAAALAAGGSAASAGPADGSVRDRAGLRGLLDPLTALTLPTISGTPAVGSTLALTPPTWSLTGVVNQVQWLRDGTAVAVDGVFVCVVNATSACGYPVSADDVGHNVQARVTGSLGETPGVQVLSNVIAVPSSGGGGGGGDGTPVPIPVATRPVVTGTPKVGQTLAVDTVTSPVWGVPGVTETHRWLLGTTPIAGATGTTYVVRPADVGQQISFEAAGELGTGYLPTLALSDPVTAAKGDAPTADPAPYIKGTYAVFQTLRVRPGTWGETQPDPAFSFQWRRDGVAIPSATLPTYTLTTLDGGRTVDVVLTATRDGYEPGTAEVPGAVVPRLTSTTTATLARAKVHRGRHAILATRVVVAGLDGPGGGVSVYDGTRLLKTLRLPTTGRLKITLPVLRPGVHRIWTRYLGATGVAGSHSTKLRLTVLR